MNTTPTMTAEAAQYARHPILRQHVNESVAKSGSGAVLVSASAVADLFTDLDALRAHLTALEARCEALEALSRYAEHSGLCNANANGIDGDCACGLFAAIDRARGMQDE